MINSLKNKYNVPIKLLKTGFVANEKATRVGLTCYIQIWSPYSQN